MANELQATGSVSFTRAPAAQVMLASTNQQYDVGGIAYIRATQIAPIDAPVLLNLGAVVKPGWFYIKNLSAANFMLVLTAIAGDALLKIKPGAFAIGCFAVLAPAVLGDTAPCQFEYMVMSEGTTLATPTAPPVVIAGFAPLMHLGPAQEQLAKGTLVLTGKAPTVVVT